MIEPNGTLTRDPQFGYVWTTECRKCGTKQRIRIGDVSLFTAAAAISEIDTTPRECPGGYHVEMGGWSRLWSLDLMLERYAAELATAPQATLAAAA